MQSSPVTPSKSKGLMGPPPTPITPGTQLVLRTPSASPSPRYGSVIRARSELRESTPVRVKLEPALGPPSPSPSPRARTPSQALVPHGNNGASPSSARERSVSRSLTPALLQARNRTPSQSPARDRTPSQSPAPPRASTRSPSRCSRASSISSTSSRASRAASELSISSAGSRTFRQGTYDIDPRATKRTRRVREDGSSPPTPNALSATKSLPTELETTVSGFVSVIDKWLPVKEGVLPSEFRKGCMDRALFSLFDKDMSTISEEVANELNEDSDHKLDPSTVKELISLLKLTCRSMMNAGLNEYSTGATPKSKSKTTKQGEWYMQYHASLPLLGGIVKAELSGNVASDILSWLVGRWQSNVDKFKLDLESHIEVVTSSDCRRVIENARKMCDTVISDIWSSKSSKK